MPARHNASAENQSVARALKVLMLLAERQEPLGVREIARRLGVAPSIAQRLIRTMANSGFVEQTDTTLRYGIGYKAFQIGNAFVGQNNVYTVVLPELHAFADQHINGFLGVRRDRHLVYLATVQSNGPIAMTHRPGAQTYLHSTAMGKAMLAEMSDDEVRSLLGRSPLQRLTPKTRVSLDQLVAELHEVRRLGYALSDEENRAGFFSAGAVVRDAGARAVAVLSGAVPTAGLDGRGRAKIIDLVLKAAHTASRRLGAPVSDVRFNTRRPAAAALRRRRS